MATSMNYNSEDRFTWTERPGIGRTDRFPINLKAIPHQESKICISLCLPSRLISLCMLLLLLLLGGGGGR